MDFETEAELLSDESVRVEEPARRHGAWRAAAVASALLVATAVLSVGFGHSPATLGHVAARPSLMVLDEMPEDPCSFMPYLRINGIKSNNLGGKGPDTSAEEGIIYAAKAHHIGLNETDVEIHMHAVSEYYFGHSEAEGTAIPAQYTPQWPKVNGVKGHFGTINIHPGTNVTIQIRGFDPAENANVSFPKWAITFFDLDTGKGGNRSVEFVRINNFKAYYVTNETELKVTPEPDGGTKFSATVEGTGDDNPDNPLELTVQQKNRAVSFEFEGADEVIAEVGATEGSTARVFQFVVRPILRCAYTKLADGTLLAANDTNSPVVPVRGGGAHARPGAALALGLLMLAAWRWE